MKKPVKFTTNYIPPEVYMADCNDSNILPKLLQ